MRASPPSLRAALSVGAAVVLAVSVPTVANSQGGGQGVGPGWSSVPVAGNGETGYSGDGGDARDARLGDRLSIDVGPDGEVYIADTESGRVREVTPERTIDTVEHSGAGDSEDDCAEEVVEGFQWCPSNQPHAVVSDDDGNAHIAASTEISKVDGDGETTVLGGNGEREVDDEGKDGGDGGPATEAWIYEPTDIDVDGEGNVYVADPNNDRIRMIDPDGEISSVAGGGDTSLRDAESGPATDVALGSTIHDLSLAVDDSGTVFFAVDGGARVFQVDSNGDLSVAAGTGTDGYSGDGGPATEADLSAATSGLTVDEGTLYIGDGTAGTIRTVDSDGTINTLGGGFGDLQDIAVGPGGALYVATTNQVTEHVSNEEGEPDVAGGANPWADLRPGEVATVAGTGDAPPEEPEDTPVAAPEIEEDPSRFVGIAAADDGAVYFTQRGRNDIRRVTPSGDVETIAGGDESGFGGDDGPAVDAQLHSPAGLALASDGTLVVADAGNNRVREISPDGTITTTVGNGDSGDSDGWSSSGLTGEGGPATEAELSSPGGVAVDDDGVRYVADTGNNQIHRVDDDGDIETVAGNGERYFSGDGGPATDAQLYGPADVAVHPDGDVYLTDMQRHSVRRVDTGGEISTVAGSGDHTIEVGDFSGDDGPADDATLNTPTGLTTGPDGTVYIADTWNNRIRRVDSDGTIDTAVGSGVVGLGGDGGPATDAELGEPTEVAVAPGGDLVVADSRNDRIRRVDSDGDIDTVAETESPTNDDPAGSGAADTDIKDPHYVAVGAGDQVHLGSLYEGLRFTVDAAESTIDTTDPRTTGDSQDDGRAVLHDLATDDDGNVLLAAGGEVRRISPSGGVTIVAGGGGAPVEDGATATAVSLGASSVAADGAGGFYIVDDSVGDGRILAVDADGTISVVGGAGEANGSGETVDDLKAGFAIATNANGDLYAAELYGDRVVRVADSGAISTVAGTDEEATGETGDGGPATEADVTWPSDVEVADDGTLYIAESEGVRRVTPDGTIDTIVENEDDSGSSGKPNAIALDSHGNLYFAVPAQNQVRVLAQVGEIPTSVPWVTLVFWVAVGLALAVTPRRREAAGWVRHNVPRAWSRLRAGVRPSMDPTALEDRTARSATHGDAPTGGGGT